jgi:predicted NUDIX family phosphoesterase
VKHDELILAVRRSTGPTGINPRHGFRHAPYPEAFQVLERHGLWLAPRRELERDEGFLQLIPYIVLANESGVLCYRRSKSGGESRLHEQWSIGIGGHVELSDMMIAGGKVDLAETLELAGGREVFEEVGWHVSRGFDWLGPIYDNEHDVGRVHLGIVGLLRVKGTGPLVTKTEHSIAEHRVLNVGQLEEHAGSMESWSRMIVPAVVGVLR